MYIITHKYIHLYIIMRSIVYVYVCAHTSNLGLHTYNSCMHSFIHARTHTKKKTSSFSFCQMKQQNKHDLTLGICFSMSNVYSFPATTLPRENATSTNLIQPFAAVQVRSLSRGIYYIRELIYHRSQLWCVRVGDLTTHDVCARPSKTQLLRK